MYGLEGSDWQPTINNNERNKIKRIAFFIKTGVSQFIYNDRAGIILITRRAEFHGLCPWVNEKAAI